MSTQLKRFIVRKYVMAKSAKDAIRKDRTASVDEVYVDERWLEESTKRAIGFADDKR